MQLTSIHLSWKQQAMLWYIYTVCVVAQLTRTMNNNRSSAILFGFSMNHRQVTVQTHAMNSTSCNNFRTLNHTHTASKLTTTKTRFELFSDNPGNWAWLIRLIDLIQAMILNCAPRPPQQLLFHTHKVQFKWICGQMVGVLISQRWGLIRVVLGD